MSNSQQYLLDLKLPISFQEEDYIVTNSNYLAWNFIKKWPNWGETRMSNIACIYGETGAGKSHLASIWQKLSGARIVTTTMPAAGNLLIDNLDGLLREEEQLFNLLNHVIDSKNYLLITANKAPEKLDIALPDLRSRLLGILSIELARPDDEIIERIITKYFSDLQMPINPAVIKFLVNRIDRSYSEISATLKALNKISMAEKRRISIPFVKEVLNAYNANNALDSD